MLILEFTEDGLLELLPGRYLCQDIHAGGSSSDDVDGTMSTALEEELESLYPEIEILAEIETVVYFLRHIV
jgi:hypothetical protein